MYLIMLKCLFFNIKVTLPLWCLLLLPQMRTAKSISLTFKHFLKRFLSSFLFFIIIIFFLLWKSRCSKAPSNWKPAIYAQRLKPNIYNKLIQWEMSPQWPWSWSGNSHGHWSWLRQLSFIRTPRTVIFLTFLTSPTPHVLDTKGKINMKPILTISHSTGFTITYKAVYYGFHNLCEKIWVFGWRWPYFLSLSL